LEWLVIWGGKGREVVCWVREGAEEEVMSGKVWMGMGTGPMGARVEGWGRRGLMGKGYCKAVRGRTTSIQRCPLA
jgi:hypothetical protein